MTRPAPAVDGLRRHPRQRSDNTRTAIEDAVRAAPRLRITELFRRVDGEWKVFHRHADMVPER